MAVFSFLTITAEQWSASPARERRVGRAVPTKLADAAFLAAHEGLIVAGNGSADRELERKIPVATQARIPNRTAPLRVTAVRSQQIAPSSGQLAGPSLMITPRGYSSRGESQGHGQKLLRSAP
jgi:hypothetical protein